jgi:DivIVA domain-containing protein
MSFTAEEVHRLEFTNAPIGRRGYAKHEVDQFVERIARTLDGKDDLTPAEVHHVMFGKPLLGRRGYDERQVDEFLDAVEEELSERFGHAPSLPEAREESQAIKARGTERDAADRGRGA